MTNAASPSAQDPTVEFIDDAPEDGNPITPGPDFTCEVCGTGLTYGGRGRKPRFCVEHKPGAKSTSGSTRRSTISVDRAITELEMLHGMGGQAIKLVLSPRAGEIVYTEREKLAESWRMLLETNKRVRDMFTNLESKAAWLPMVIAYGDVMAAIWLSGKAEKMLQREYQAQQAEQAAQNGSPDFRIDDYLVNDAGQSV